MPETPHMGTPRPRVESHAGTPVHGFSRFPGHRASKKERKANKYQPGEHHELLQRAGWRLTLWATGLHSICQMRLANGSCSLTPLRCRLSGLERICNLETRQGGRHDSTGPSWQAPRRCGATAVGGRQNSMRRKGMFSVVFSTVASPYNLTCGRIIGRCPETHPNDCRYENPAMKER